MKPKKRLVNVASLLFKTVVEVRLANGEILTGAPTERNDTRGASLRAAVRVAKRMAGKTRCGDNKGAIRS